MRHKKWCERNSAGRDHEGGICGRCTSSPSVQVIPSRTDPPVLSRCVYERAFALEIKRLEMLYCRVRILYDMGMYDQAWGQVPMRSRKIPEMLRHGYWKAISPLKKG